MYVRAALSLTAVVIASGFAMHTTQPASAHSLCGVERWAVKTLQDKPALLPPRTVTLRYLVTRPAPAALGDTRLPFERHVYRVVAAVTLVRAEGDGDLHLSTPQRESAHDRGSAIDVMRCGRHVGPPRLLGPSQLTVNTGEGSGPLEFRLRA